MINTNTKRLTKLNTGKEERKEKKRKIYGSEIQNR